MNLEINDSMYFVSKLEKGKITIHNDIFNSYRSALAKKTVLNLLEFQDGKKQIWKVCELNLKEVIGDVSKNE